MLNDTCKRMHDKYKKNYFTIGNNDRITPKNVYAIKCLCAHFLVWKKSSTPNCAHTDNFGVQN